jgi:hypothetical protein
LNTVTYKLLIANSTTDESSKTFYFNRTVDSTGGNGHEAGVSTCCVKELPQQTTLHNPRYNSVIEQEGQVLETLAGVCDGRSVSVSSGTYTLQNVTAEQDLSTTYVDLTGSTINYKPPPGTKQIIYKFHALVRRDGGNYMLFHSKCFVDGQECTDFRMMEHNYAASHSFVVFYYVFNIGTKDEIASGNFLSWDTNKTIKISVREYGSNDTATFHQTDYHDGGGTDVFCAPRLEIQAIGRKSDTTFLNSFFNERKGQVLETLSGVCDGRSVEVDSGTYTLANVSSTQNATTSWADVTGSSISYTPPSGTKQVVFEFHTGLSTDTDTGTTIYDGQGHVLVKMLIDGTSVTSQNQEWGHAAYAYADNFIYRGIIDITGTDDVANGKLSSWTSNKTIKLQFVGYANNFVARIHTNRAGNLPTSNADVNTLIKPRMKITAIGDAAIQNATVVAGNSMVHFQGYSKTFNIVGSERRVQNFQDMEGNIINAGMTLTSLKNFGNCMNTTTGVFTTPHNGLYSINMVTHQNGDSNGVWMELVIDGKFMHFGDTGTNNDSDIGPSITLYIETGKEIYLRVGTTNTTSINYAPYNGLSFSITALQDRVPQALSARPGMTLETLAGVCDGRSVTVSSGTYTLENVTAKQDGTGTFVRLTGSTIDYKPPPGTRQVIYELKFHAGWDKEGGTTFRHFHQKFMFNNTEVSAFNETYETNLARDGPAVMRAVIEIGGENDIPNGKVSSWDSLAKLEVFVRQYDSNQSGDDEADFHWVYYWDGSSGSNYSFLMKPTLTIQAIGDGPGIVPSTGMNVVKVSTGTTASYTPPKSSPGVEIEHLRISIKPTATDSVISLQWDVFCDGYRNIGFRVTRNITGTDVLVYDDSKGVRGSFLAMVPFDETGTTSTQTSPQTAQISWHDEPNTTSTVTYKLWVGNSWNTNEGFFLNKSMHSTDSDGREYGVSSAIAIEYPTTARPLDTENALTIPPFVGATNKEKLYNQSGDLYFNGKQLSNEWYKNGGDLYRLAANVGIGKSSPAYKLDVLGDINFTGSLRRNGIDFGIPGLWAGSTNVYRSTGMVGIGTSTFVDTVRNAKGIHIVNSHGISFQSNTGVADSRNWRIRSDDYGSNWGVLQFSVSSNNSSAPSGESNVMMTLNKDGNVGIGTTSPSGKLHVSNDSGDSILRIETKAGNTKLAGIEFWTDDSTPDVANNASFPATRILSSFTGTTYETGYLKFQTHHSNSTTYNDTMIIKGPNVGIGTMSPDSNVRLQIESNHNDGARLKIKSTNASSGWKAPVIDLCLSGGSSNLIFAHGDPNTSGIWFRPALNKNIIFDFQGTGKVGIGTSSPGGKLEVHGGYLGLKNGNHTATTNQQILFGFSGVSNLEYPHSIRTRHQGQPSGSNTDNSIDFYLWKKGDTTTTVGSTHGMSITAAGVGIGTTSPGAPLHVKHSGGGGLYLETTQGDANGSTNFISFRDSGGQSGFIGDGSGGNKTFYIYWYRGGIIFNSTPSYNSDDRLKHNESPIENALTAINQIEVRSYFRTFTHHKAEHNFELDDEGNPITDEPYVHEVGVIAQQLQTIDAFRKTVTSSEEPAQQTDEGEQETVTTLSVNYNDIFMYNVQATQELYQHQQADKAKIQTLETEVASLKTTLASQQTLIQSLMTRLEALENP